MINSLFGAAGKLASEAYDSDYLQVGNQLDIYDKLSLIVTCSGISHTNGTLSVYVSNDLDHDTLDKAILYTTLTINTTAYAAKVEIEYPYYKLRTSYAKGSNTSGTIWAYLASKK